MRADANRPGPVPPLPAGRDPGGFGVPELLPHIGHDRTLCEIGAQLLAVMAPGVLTHNRVILAHAGLLGADGQPAPYTYRALRELVRHEYAVSTGKGAQARYMPHPALSHPARPA